MVSETSASEDGNLEEGLRVGKPSSRSAVPGLRPGLMVDEADDREYLNRLFDGHL
jgi:hypothetical protein